MSAYQKRQQRWLEKSFLATQEFVSYVGHKLLVKERKREKPLGGSRQSRHDLVVHRKNSKRNIFRHRPSPSQGSRKKTGRRKNKRRRVVLVGAGERDTRRAELSGEVVCSRDDCGRGSQRRSQRWGQTWSGGGENYSGRGIIKAATRALHGRVGGEAGIGQI